MQETSPSPTRRSMGESVKHPTAPLAGSLTSMTLQSRIACCITRMSVLRCVNQPMSGPPTSMRYQSGCSDSRDLNAQSQAGRSTLAQFLRFSGCQQQSVTVSPDDPTPCEIGLWLPQSTSTSQIRPILGLTSILTPAPTLVSSWKAKSSKEFGQRIRRW